MGMVPQSHALPVLITRPEPQAARFVRSLQDRYGDRITCIPSPVLVPVYLRPPLPQAPFNAVVFTSETGARAAADYVKDLPNRAFCVGGRTTQVAAEAGFAAQSAEGDAESLFALLIAQRRYAPFLHLRGREARGDLVDRLKAADVAATGLVVYAQEPLDLSDEALRVLSGDSPVLVPLFSPRSAEVFCRALRSLNEETNVNQRLSVVALSPAVAAAFHEWPASRLGIATKPTQAELLSALDRFIITA